jgi:hypothetical protein
MTDSNGKSLNRSALRTSAENTENNSLRAFDGVRHKPKSVDFAQPRFRRVALLAMINLRARQQSFRSGFHAYLADAADQVVGGGFAWGQGDDFDGIGLIVGT